MFSNIINKLLNFLLVASLMIASTAWADVFENIEGQAANNQGNLSYSVPLNFPESINGLRPHLSVDYFQNGSGILGSGFVLSGFSNISRCSPSIKSHGKQGGVEANSKAVYCLDGDPLKLIDSATNTYGQYADDNIRLIAVGNIAEPIGWIVNDPEGYIYHYELVDNQVKKINQSWHLKSKEDRFGNTVSYTLDLNQLVKKISYPGFTVDFKYKDSSYVNKIYSNGALKNIGKLLESVELSRNNIPIYSYNFLYSTFSGFEAQEADRLDSINKCYLIDGSSECSRPIEFEYKTLTGEDPSIRDYLPRAVNITNIFSKETLAAHSNLSEAKSVAAYYSVDLDNQYGEDVCFYSKNDRLVCAIANGSGGFSLDDNYASGFLLTEDDFDKYSSLNFVDINRDGYADLCIADDGGIKCAQTSTAGVMGSPSYILTELNFKKGYQFLDVNRDSYIDVCGAVSDDHFQCFENIEGASFDTVPIVDVSGDYSAIFDTNLKLSSDADTQFYKKMKVSLVDINGDQIPDLCGTPNLAFSCLVGSYNANDELSFSTDVYRSNSDLYEAIPVHLVDFEYDPINEDRGVSNAITQFSSYKSRNEEITLSTKLNDVNADGLIDLCYMDGYDFKCQLNSDIGFTTPQVWVSFLTEWQSFNKNKLRSLKTSISLVDINSDGLSDACLMQSDIQYCAYNNGQSFSGFTKRLNIVSDVLIIADSERVYVNHIRKLLGRSLNIVFSGATNVYGNILNLNDINGDGRSEVCMRTINGVDCHSNQQQSYYSQLESVTTAHGVITNFRFSNDQTGDWYHSTGVAETGYIEATPRQTMLLSIETDDGTGLAGSSSEVIDYAYYDYLYNPGSGEGSFRKIVQSSGASNKIQETEYFIEEDITGRVKKVTEKVNDVVVSISTNRYQVESTLSSIKVLTSQTIEQQFDPLNSTQPIRTITKVYSDFDDLGFAKNIIETNAVPLSTKTTETSIEYKHDEDLWVLGRPEVQIVSHSLTPFSEISPNQTNKVSFEYYPSTMALKLQTIEPDSDQAKTVEFTYFPNGTLQQETQTGLVDASTPQARFNSYTFNDIGQQTSVTNALGITARVEYHASCMAKEKTFDALNRQMELYTYNSNCQLERLDSSTGQSVGYVNTWDDSLIEKPSESTVDNYALILTKEISNTGVNKWNYIDRLGRTVKSLGSISKTNTVTTNAIVISHYNKLGQVIAQSQKTKESSGALDTINWIKSAYDDYGRLNLINAIAADANYYDRSITYQGLRTIDVFNGRSTIKEVGVQGKVIYTSNNGKEVNYEYSALGQLAKTTHDNNSNTAIRIMYDEFGIKESQTDPSVGTWLYQHNAFGELYEQTDAESQVTSIRYDKAGRKDSQTTKEGTSTWVYYVSTDDDGYGQLSYTLAPSQIKRYYEYDHLGRLEFESLLEGTVLINKTRFLFDIYGRLQTTEYNQSANNSKMTTPISNAYDQAGRLSQVLMPASKLQSYDYDLIAEEYSQSLSQIISLQAERQVLVDSMSYHAERIGYYEAKIQGYTLLADNTLAPLVDSLNSAIIIHENLLNDYKARHDAYVEKAASYGSISSEREYKYKGNDKDGNHVFEYNRCVSYHGYSITRHCDTRRIENFTVSQPDFEKLLPESKITQDCKQVTHRRYRSTRTVCTARKFNSNLIYNELINKYAKLMTYEQAIIDSQQDAKETIANDYISVKQEQVVITEGQWVVIASNPLLMLQTTVQSQSIKMTRTAALSYYQAKVTENQQNLTAEKTELLAVENSVVAKDDQLTSAENAKEGLLQNIKEFISLEILQDGINAQNAMEDQSLVVWAALSYDANGKLKNELYGNGLKTEREFDSETKQLTHIRTLSASSPEISDLEYIYTADGFLDQKIDHTRGISEVFAYRDGQIDQWDLTTTAGGSISRSYLYDDLGNITQKNNDNLTTHEYNDTSRPYQLSKFNGQAILYDAKGFIEAGNGRSYVWNSFGKAQSISANGQTVSFKYDAAQNRARKTSSEGTTYYISSGYEQVHSGNGDIIHRYHVKNGYHTVATIERYEYETVLTQGEVDSRIQDSVAYYHRDILGSGVLITGSKTEVVAERHYAPFGEEIDITELRGLADLEEDEVIYDSSFIQSQDSLLNAAEGELDSADRLLGQVLTVTSINELISLKGFTAHEALADVGLVHMNARLYDPELGRFASPDSMIPEPGNAMAYNRYSYVYNNPTLASDPSGHWVNFAYAVAAYVFVQGHSDNKYLQIASAVWLAVATGDVFAGKTISGAVVTQGGLSLVTGYLQSGKIGTTEIRSAVLSGAAAGLARWIGHGNKGGPQSTDWEVQASYHGLAQGSIGWLRNKDFWSGFVAGTVGHGVGANMDTSDKAFSAILARTAISSGIAAIAARATGGDPAAAAMSAAIVHLYNRESDPRQSRKSKYKLQLINKNITVRESTVIGGTRGFVSELLGLLGGGKAVEGATKVILKEGASNVMSELGSYLDFDEIRIDSVVYNVNQLQRSDPILFYGESDGYIMQYKDPNWQNIGPPQYLEEVDRTHITTYREGVR
jgi:RHS repeat-associated protein